jgi:hypothetical protein
MTAEMYRWWEIWIQQSAGTKLIVVFREVAILLYFYILFINGEN